MTWLRSIGFWLVANWDTVVSVAKRLLDRWFPSEPKPTMAEINDVSEATLAAMREGQPQPRWHKGMQVTCSDCDAEVGFTALSQMPGESEATPLVDFSVGQGVFIWDARSSHGRCPKEGCDGLWFDERQMLHLSGWQRFTGDEYATERQPVQTVVRTVHKRTMSKGWH